MNTNQATCNTNDPRRNSVNHHDLPAVMEMEGNTLKLNLQTGIIKSLYAKGLLTQKQMEEAIKKLNVTRRENNKC
jgi:hypothetical protein